MTKALVIGATGFIGGHIAKKALEAGWQVSGLRRDPNGLGHLAGEKLEWITGDLDQPSSLVEAMSGMDYVFHAGAFFPTSYDPRLAQSQLDLAAEQMQNVIRAARQAGIKRLVYTSSLTTIGLPPAGEGRLADERDIYQPGSLPGNVYYEAKSIMEELALEACGVGCEIVILNPTLVMGPGDTHLSSSEILLLIARGKAWAVPPGTINIIDARDLAEAQISAARKGRSGQRYILGGDNYPIREAAAIIAEIAGVRPPAFTIPAGLIDLYLAASRELPFIPPAPYHLQAYRHWQGFQVEKAREELGLRNRTLQETVRDSLSYFRDQGVL